VVRNQLTFVMNRIVLYIFLFVNTANLLRKKTKINIEG